MYRRYFKRLIDFFVSGIAFLAFSPLFIVLILLLAIANNGKPFFFQIRPGRNGKLFKIIKFKTMNDKRAPDGALLPDAERLTSVGSFVRKTSLDELPQLINVVKGDMSLIGPRPLLPQYLELYNSVQRRRHEVRPGITGWAQVNGRNAIAWKQKFEYDVWYVDHLSLQLDLKIIFMTISKVLKGADVSQSGHVTTTYFMGNDD